MCSLLLASVIMFLQTIINLLLLKNYYKFHSFRVRNVLISFLYLIIWYDFAAWFGPFLISLIGDIEANPGPKPISGQSFSICHWNLNSISVHNYTKIYLTAYVLVHNFDIICLSETYQPKRQQMTKTWKYLVTVCFALTILPKIKEEASVSFTGLLYL